MCIMRRPRRNTPPIAAGELDSVDFKVHGPYEACSVGQPGGCTCAGARQVLLWPPSGVEMGQPTKLRKEECVAVLQHWNEKLQQLQMQLAAEEPVASELQAFEVLQPCEEYIAAALAAVKEQQRQPRVRKASTMAAAAHGHPPAAASGGKLPGHAALFYSMRVAVVGKKVCLLPAQLVLFSGFTNHRMRWQLVICRALPAIQQQPVHLLFKTTSSRAAVVPSLLV